MTSPRFARLAAQAMAEQHKSHDHEPLPPAPAQRAEAIVAIENAIRANAQRRTLRRAAVGALAVAAAIALATGAVRIRASHNGGQPVASVPAATAAANASAFAIAHPSGDGASLVAPSLVDPQTAPMIEGQPLTAGSRVVARPGGRALLAFATGTQLTVEEGGDLTIEDGGRSKVFALHAGAVRADVAKLEAGERLVVRTPDAEVEVRGTAFRLAIAPPDAACGNGTTTRLSVYHGTVVVRSGGTETRVDGGSDWPASCGVVAERSATTHGHASHKIASGSRVASSAAASPLSGSTTVETVMSAPLPGSTLAEQNDQFAEALGAKRAGDSTRAIARFDAFLAKYPSSPLAESATAQRMKLLHEVDSPRAPDAARAYLARWPNGFAKSDASMIVGQSR